jgi:hypothetical protein
MPKLMATRARRVVVASTGNQRRAAISTLASDATDWRTRMEQHEQQRTSTPKVGMTRAFTAQAEPALAHIPATVVAVWPPFRSGAQLVTLEFTPPVHVGHAHIDQMEAFVSELYMPAHAPNSRPSRGVTHAPATLARTTTILVRSIRQGIRWTRIRLDGSYHSVPRVQPPAAVK